MTEVGRVSAVYRYPVKTMLGEAPDNVMINEVGIVDDRGWGGLRPLSAAISSPASGTPRS